MKTKKIETAEWNPITIPQNGVKAYYPLPFKQPFMPIPDGFGFYGVPLQDKPSLEGTVMYCNECGKGFAQLGNHITKTHGYKTTREYKDKYGLLYLTSLSIERIREIRSKTAKENYKNGKFKLPPTSRYFIKGHRNNPRQNNSNTATGSHKIQMKNLWNRCDAQIIDQLQKLSEKIRKPNISERDLYRLGEGSLFMSLQHRFGSFQNAKKVAGLPINKDTKVIGKLLTPEMMLGCIRGFYNLYGKPPSQSDFLNHKLPFGLHALSKRFGNLTNAIKETGLDEASLYKQKYEESEKRNGTLMQKVLELQTTLASRS